MIKKISSTRDLGDLDESTVIVFINHEERCKGLFNQVNKEIAKRILIFERVGEKNEIVDEADARLGGDVIDINGSDEIEVASKLISEINDPTELIIDISILDKPELLILLAQLNMRGLYDRTRLIYSEPNDYISSEYEIPSKGIKRIDSVPGFVSQVPMNREDLLILLLGYEPARSKAIYNNIDPSKTFLIVPDPPYKPEWENRTRTKNQFLINTVGEDNVVPMHALDPQEFVQDFNEFLVENGIQLDQWNTIISPLSTKPQAVGLFKIWMEQMNNFSLVYSQPLENKKLFLSSGIANTWELVNGND